jgi:phospholipase C
MAHEDCDTVPLLWNYANRFVLFDHIFQSYTGPSTPGNLAIISAQAGDTQAALHPNDRYTDDGSGNTQGLPAMNDLDPANPPYNNVSGSQLNLTYASLPLTLAGNFAALLPKIDRAHPADLADIGDDIAFLAKNGGSPYSWGWFQEGFDREPGSPSASASSGTYVTHHNGPQYFGYIAHTIAARNLHGLGDFMTAVSKGTLGGAGVYYLKGGTQNFIGLSPSYPGLYVQFGFQGDDDHPRYSDAQISEALVAENINAIVRSKYWPQSAIIVTYDDSEGDYDHVAPPLRAIGPGTNLPQDFISDGPRVPFILISPFAKTNAVEHAYGDQGSVVKFVDTVFGLTPLAALPDEQKGRGLAELAGKLNYGPDDGQTSGAADLIDAFDPDILAGSKMPLSAGYAYVDPTLIYNLPAQTGLGCKAIHVTPVDELRGIRNNIPKDFNPRPGTEPTEATARRINARARVMHLADPQD